MTVLFTAHKYKYYKLLYPETTTWFEKDIDILENVIHIRMRGWELTITWE